MDRGMDGWVNLVDYVVLVMDKFIYAKIGF